jgi:hypothetical protein
MRIWSGIKRGDKKQTAKIGDRNLNGLDGVKGEWAHGKSWWWLGAINEGRINTTREKYNNLLFGDVNEYI